MESDDVGKRGIGGDALDLCLPEAGYRLNNDGKPLKRMYNALHDGTADINIMSYAKDREDYLYFGKETIFTASYRPFVRSDSSIVIKSLADFDRLRLGHRQGLQYSPEFLAYVMKRDKENTLDTADLDTQNIQKLLTKRIDVFVNTAETVHWLAKEIGRGDEVKELDYTVRSSSYVVTVAKKSKAIKDAKEFLDKIDACIGRLRKDGTLDKIYQRYKS